MARRKFAKLKSLMYEREMTQAEAAKELGCSLIYVSHRLNGHQPFTFRDAEILGCLLDIPREEWADFFTDSEANANGKKNGSTENVLRFQA